jgi:hypothetical protein
VLTAAEILEEATYRAKVPGYSPTFGLRNLNAVLSDICQHYDYALARGVFNFSFNPSLVSLFGCGPIKLPLDYLRTSGSSGATGASKSVWYKYPAPNLATGYQVIELTPVDLAEFDQFPQFAQGRSLPNLWATDMGAPLTDRIVLSTTGDVNGTDASLYNLVSITGLVVGQSVAGQGIEPGSTILAINTTTNQVDISQTTTGAINSASLFFGIAPVAYVYLPPLDAYPATCRYQRQMPPIVSMAQVPWFPDEGYLISELAGRLCEISDDARSVSLHAIADQKMRKYSEKADDKTNRAQQVQLDPRNFGGGTPYGRARNTKWAGWLVLLTISLGSILSAPVFG